MIVHPASIHVEVTTADPVEIDQLREAIGRAVTQFRADHPDAAVASPVIARRPCFETVIG